MTLWIWRCAGTTLPRRPHVHSDISNKQCKPWLEEDRSRSRFQSTARPDWSRPWGTPHEVAQHVVPFRGEARGPAALGQLLLQHQGEEGAEDVAADGGIGGV